MTPRPLRPLSCLRRLSSLQIVPAVTAAGLLVWMGAGLWISPADAQNPALPDSRYAGLQWTFARIRYEAWTVPSGPFLNRKKSPFRRAS